MGITAGDDTEDVYKCKVFVDGHELISRPARLDIIRAPVVTVHEEKVATVGDDVVLQCHVQSLDTIQCPHCQLRITTSTSSKPGFMAWFLSAALCFTGFWPCFCVPFMVDSLQNVKHICPSCKLVVGRYQEGC